jgi:TraG-like protein, N-terminal region.
VRAFTAAVSNVLTFSSTDKLKDEVARMASTTANPVFVDTDKIMGDSYDMGTTVGRAITGAASTFGVAKESFFASMSMLPLMTALPMIQALVLMGIYTFLPLVVLLSGYDLKVLFLGAIALFSVKMWAAMWYIATWVDGHLINAMYPGALGNYFVQEAMMIAKGAVPPTYKRMILNTLLVFLYVGLPLIWSSMMAWMGLNVAHGVDGLMSKNGTAMGNAGKSSASLAMPKKRK